jgi:L-histidine Nalpha-methyltransferase
MPDGNGVTFYDLSPREESFREAVLAGLGRPKKAIPCKFLYDARGSALFEEICRLPEYYPTRTEIGILEENAAAIAERIGRHCQLIDFGSGASRKARILLEALEEPAAYVPVDISRDHLIGAAARLAADFPLLPVIALCADYTRPFVLPPLPEGGGKKVGFFPGSTIGNLEPETAEAFLAGCMRLLGRRGAMLVGVDLKKERTVLDAAYNDRAGVTALFNLNLLERINRELDGNLDIAQYEHFAFYNSAMGRVEIYIRSLAQQEARIAGRRTVFERGELIHTEYSYKYSIAEFQALARRAGFSPGAVWTDAGSLFSVHYLCADESERDAFAGFAE